MSNNTIVFLVAMGLFIAIAVLSFFVGRKYEANKQDRVDSYGADTLKRIKKMLEGF